MSAALKLLATGPAVSLQDAGRFGLMRFGVTAAGPMDPLAFATANRAASAPPGAAAIEISLGGLELTAVGATVTVALAGGAFDISLDGTALPPAVRLALEPGARLRVRAGPAGAWCYLAVGGRIDVAPMLGSVATHARSGLGGLGGRALAAGDLLPLADPAPAELGAAALAAPWLERPGELIRVILGPQADYFAADQIAAFCAGPWRLSPRSDRMGYVLDGPRLGHAHGFNIVSDGIALGAIQVPGDGQPIVLMADRQVTGGYPKIATVIGPDLGRLAQRRPGAQLRFAAVTIADAVAARRAERAALQAPLQLAPVIRKTLSSELLLGINLIGGVTRGH
jgi:5-oxoprolinase (ATP-hydrolysing) subunit C